MRGTRSATPRGSGRQHNSYRASPRAGKGDGAWGGEPDAERKVPGPQGPATFRALRPAARVRPARARQRSVTSPRRTGPHVGLFGSRQAPPLPRPLPLCQDGGVRESRAYGRLALCFPASRPASVLRRTRTSEPGHSLDLVCHLPPGLSPGPAAVGPQPRVTFPAGRPVVALFSVPARR